ncbi:MAG: GNAT family N-acetyltransferase [Thermomicrobiales bacterium]
MTVDDVRAPILRLATLADVPAIADVHVRAWQRAYRGILPDAFLDALAPEQRHARWEREVAAPDDEITVIVAADRTSGRILGFCSVCPQKRREPGDDALPATGELHTMYVDGEETGRGTGRRLMGAGEDRMREMGFTRGVLWMLAENAPARGFYERMGWRADGVATEIPYGDRLVPEIRLTRTLMDRPAQP